MILSGRYLSSINNEYIALGTKSKLFDPTFSNDSELIVLCLKTNSRIGREMSGRFNDILLIDDMVVCALEQELVIYRIVSAEKCNEEAQIVENSGNTHNFECLISIKVVVSSMSYNQKRNMLLLSADKLILLDMNTFKTYNVGISDRCNSISYNRKVNHIIAACIGDELVIYDIKKKEEIIRKTFAGLRKVEWHPFTSTCLFVLEAGLNVLDLSNDKLSKICESCANFLIRDDTLYTWDQNVLNVYNTMNDGSLVYSGKFEIADMFCFNTNGRLAVLSLLSGSTMIRSVTTLFYTKRECIFSLMNNLIVNIVDGNKLKIKKISAKQMCTEKNVHELFSSFNKELKYEKPRLNVESDEIVGLILEKNWDEIKKRNITTNVPLSYFIDEDKEVLTDNLRLLLLICVKNDDYKFLIQNNIVDYKYLLKHLDKNELVVLAEHLAGKVPFNEIAEIYEMADDKKLLFKIKFDCVKKLADQIGICDLHNTYLSFLREMKDAQIFFEDPVIDYFMEYSRFVEDTELSAYLDNKKGVTKKHVDVKMGPKGMIKEHVKELPRIGLSAEHAHPPLIQKKKTPDIPFLPKTGKTPADELNKPAPSFIPKSPRLSHPTPNVGDLSLKTTEKKLKYSDLLRGKGVIQNGPKPVLNVPPKHKPTMDSPIPRPSRPTSAVPKQPSPTRITSVSDEFDENEINEIDQLIQQKICELKEKTSKKTSVIFRSRIKTGLASVSQYKKVTNPNILPYLRIFKEDLSFNEFLTKSQMLLNFPEVKVWLEGIINLWRIVE